MSTISARVPARLRDLAGAVRRRLDSRPARSPATPPTVANPVRSPERDSATPVVGVVELVNKVSLKGWVSVPADSPPTLVSLHLGRLRLMATYATPDGTMTGAGADTWRGDVPMGDVPAPAAPAAPPRTTTALPRPAEDRRNSRDQVRTFSFRLREVWQYARPKNKVTIRVNGQPLPIVGHGMFLTPPRGGAHDLDALRTKLDQGYVLSQMGRIVLSKRMDVVWQQQVMDLYTAVRGALRAHVDYEPFLIYGTLLGAVREGGYIGHDADFDTAYISRYRDGPAAAAELRDIALRLIDAGFKVEVMRACLHVHDRRQPEHRIDLFHLFFDESGTLRFPFGVAGRGRFLESDWRGLREVPFPGGSAAVPVAAERLVAHLYGEDWRRPKPGFNWGLERADWADDALFTPAQRNEVYWANFYSAHEYTAGSRFFQFVDGRPDTPRTVIDIGCGDGRDACAFGASGRTVLGLDQSAVGVEHAATHAERLGVADRVRFRVCDVSDLADLEKAVDEVTGAAEGPVLFYLRFFLHAIPGPVQEGLLGVLASRARPGDQLAAEFRTDADQATTKTHTRHYRRFQKADIFVASMSDRFGFTVVHQEERSGLSPYGDEDPVLCRVIAVR